MRPQAGGGEMDDSQLTPERLFQDLGLLVMEFRCPDETASRGYVSGLHLPVFPLTSGGSSTTSEVAHSAAPEHTKQCSLTAQRREMMTRLWRNRIPMALEVLLLPDCAHGACAVGAGSVKPRLSGAELLERWIIQATLRRRAESTPDVTQLVQMMQSHLHFSQLSAWLNLSRGARPKNVLYRVSAPGDFSATSFSRPPTEHTFPEVCVGHNVLFKVRVSCLPRLELPLLVTCPQCEGREEQESTSKRNSEEPSSTGNQQSSVIAMRNEGNRCHSSPQGADKNDEGLRERKRCARSKSIKTSRSSVCLNPLPLACGQDQESYRCPMKSPKVLVSRRLSRALRTETRNARRLDFDSTPDVKLSVDDELQEALGTLSVGEARAKEGMKKTPSSPQLSHTSGHDVTVDVTPEACKRSNAAKLFLAQGEKRDATPPKLPCKRRKRSLPAAISVEDITDIITPLHVDTDVDLCPAESKPRCLTSPKPVTRPCVSNPLNSNGSYASVSNEITSCSNGAGLCGNELDDTMANGISERGVNRTDLMLTGDSRLLSKSSDDRFFADGDKSGTSLSCSAHPAEPASSVARAQAPVTASSCTPGPALPPSSLFSTKVQLRKFKSEPGSNSSVYLDSQTPEGPFVRPAGTPTSRVPRSPTDAMPPPSAAGTGLFVKSKTLLRELLVGKKENSTASSPSPTIAQRDAFQRQAAHSAKAVFHSSTGLPLQSSPAPIKKKQTGSTACFGFDSSLVNNTRGIKKVISCSGLHEYGESKEDESKRKIISTSAPAVSSNCLLGNFEESMLNGRLEPQGVVEGFSAELGAAGSFHPAHLHLPVTAFFFKLSENIAASPYLGHINLAAAGKRGYHVPKQGTVQLTLFNPNKTVVKMFVVLYSLEDMPPRSQTFFATADGVRTSAAFQCRPRDSANFSAIPHPPQVSNIQVQQALPSH